MQISDEVAATEWYEYNNGVKVTLVIMMSRAQRPVQMWAGRFAVMSLETFSADTWASRTAFHLRVLDKRQDQLRSEDKRGQQTTECTQKQQRYDIFQRHCLVVVGAGMQRGPKEPLLQTGP
ncbi:uncharacterized protein LOC134538932 [Bacillus rossius redtenbacheri]|uniref:uncharacterized protein LOC134538932 n=1 Tax=Bacillus rossius redtenbacheri TaxID=93214 RepID=UPI002FDDA461